MTENIIIQKQTDQNQINVKMQINASIFKAFIKKNALIFSETRINFNSDGMSITSMDGSHICLIHSTIMKSDCVLYEIKSNMEIGFNIEDIESTLKVIKTTKKNDPIIDISIYQKGNMEMQVGGSKIKINPIEINTEFINMDSLNSMQFDNRVKVYSKYIMNAIKMIKVNSNVAVFKMNNNEFSISTERSIGDAISEIELIESAIFNKSANTYAIQFLKCIFTKDMAKSIQIYMKNQAPLKIIEKFGNNSEFLYFLAPKVEEDKE